MQVEPAYDDFAAAYAAGRPCLLRTTLLGDLLTPVAAFIKLRHGRKGSAFLLESVEGGAARGRYSMIGIDPDVVWRCRDGQAEINREPARAPHAFSREHMRALDSLRALIAESAIPLEEGLPPM